jgi:hypothetical protein
MHGTTNPKFMFIEFVLRTEHTSVSIIKTSYLTLFRVINAVFSELRTDHIYVLYGQYVEFFTVKYSGTRQKNE